MSSIFDGSKVSGLANAVDEQIEKIQTDINTFDSDAFFKFIKDDETYSLKSQIERPEFNMDESLVSQSILGVPIMLSFPTYAYNSETGSWSSEATESFFKMFILFHMNPFDGYANGSTVIGFGPHVCEMTINMIFDEGTSDDIFRVECSEYVWRKVSFT